MKLTRITAAFAALATAAAVCSQALAQQTYDLKIKGTPGVITKYEASVGGALSFDLNGLPMPNAKMSGENLAVKINLDAYMDTQDAYDGGTVFLAKAMIKNVILGGLLQLPDIGGIGAGAAPELLLDISPQGGINNIEARNLSLPGGAGNMLGGMMPGMGNTGMDLTSLDTILPIITGLIPPILPKGPVAVGDTWVQKVSQDDMPMPIFPILEMRYKLLSVNNGVAVMEFASTGDYDAGFLNNFLSMIPEIPMGDDVMSIGKIDLKMKWEIKGGLSLAVDSGTIQDMSADSKVTVKGGAKINFTKPDGAKEKWEPEAKVNLTLNGTLKNAGEVSREQFEELFPAPAEEAEDEEPEE
jgi:hypothetical protein